MARCVWSIVAMVVFGGFLSPAAASAQGTVVGTLSVLAAPVERVPSGTVTAEPGASGTNLTEGDRIKTGPGGLAHPSAGRGAAWCGSPSPTAGAWPC